MLTFPRVLSAVLCVVFVAAGCSRKQREREQQTAQLQTISRRLDEIQANLAVMSETRSAPAPVYSSLPAPMQAAPVTLVPDNSDAVVQITDFTKAEPVSRKQQIARLGQSVPAPRASRTASSRRSSRKAASAKSKYGKVIAISGLSANDLQKALKNAGFNPGKIDGKIGPNTVSAVKQFQAAEGLAADGVVGRKTWDKLSPHLSGTAAPNSAANSSAAPVADDSAFNVF